MNLPFTPLRATHLARTCSIIAALSTRCCPNARGCCNCRSCNEYPERNGSRFALTLYLHCSMCSDHITTLSCTLDYPERSGSRSAQVALPICCPELNAPGGFSMGSALGSMAAKLFNLLCVMPLWIILLSTSLLAKVLFFSRQLAGIYPSASDAFRAFAAS